MPGHTCKICQNEMDFYKDKYIEYANGFAHTDCIQTLDSCTIEKIDSTQTLNPEFIEELRNTFPDGYPDFIDITLSEMQLHNDKNHDYAKDGDPLGNFKRVAKIMELYPNFPYAKPIGTCLYYMLKQLDAVMYMLSKNYNAKVEGAETRLGDVSVYSKIGICILRDAKARKKKGETVD